MPLSYAVITPARDEAQNLDRLAPCLISQTVLPAAWVIVDDGSADGTAELIASLAAEHPWIRLVSSGGERLARGGPIVRAFNKGTTALDPLPDVIVKLDADISFGAEHFERIVAAFEADPRLGIAGGRGYEKQPDGVWRQRHGTGVGIWGAARAYRRECLQEIEPLQERMGWDTLDLMKASMIGWRTDVLEEPFRHHRPEGERDGRALLTSKIQGEAAHFMGYRPSYLAARTLYRVLRRDPAGIGLLLGYARARLRNEPRCTDSALVEYVRRQQRVRNLPRRIREARQPRAALADRAG